MPESLAVAGGEVPVLSDGPKSARAVVVLAHGAGAGMTHDFMSAMASGLAERDLLCLRFEFLYMAAGRKAPDRAPVLEDTYRAVAEHAAGIASGRPLILGGKSMGGRIASEAVAAGAPADGLVFHGYPLHPPGRPERLRAAHLSSIGRPLLFVEGTRDPFCPLDTLRSAIASEKLDADLVVIEDGDHSFKVRKSSGRSTADAWAEAAAHTADWIDSRLLR